MPDSLHKPKHLLQWALGVIGFFIIILFVCLANSAPGAFPVDSVVSVEKGETLTGVTSKLEKLSIIRSPFVFKSLFTLFGGSKGLKAGEYYLEGAENSARIAWRMTHGQYDLKSVRITIPEGTSSAEIATLFKKEPKFAQFDPMEFVRLSSRYEGYLFPDTYLFLPSVTAEQVLETLLDTYRTKVEVLAPEIAQFKRPIMDVIKMASIVEEEARTEETRRTIAGILWKRLDIGMPLQVDAAFAFVNGKKKSSELTKADLVIDSPYNTYTHKGLPPTPISNPGLDSISATVRPIPTKYFFYLSDDNGDMHYAVTNAEHEANKAKYIK
jgi:UPF0755 protein